MKKNLKGTWFQALSALVLPIFFLGFVRWALIEPFVIPSGSMLPNLLVHDHILVKKFSYGLKVPFTDTWLIQWSTPKRGDVIVFKYPQNPKVYYIKRLVGLPGDKVEFKSGRIFVNKTEWVLEPVENLPEQNSNYEYYRESSGEEDHIVRYRVGSLQSSEGFSVELPDGEYFVMGDNRDESMDSRYWGNVSRNQLVAPAWKVLIGCEQTLASNQMLCDPATLKADRFWQEVSP